MANLALAPVNLPGGSAFYNVTSNLVVLTGNTGITFSNDGVSFLILVNGSTASTATIKIAATVEGQGVTSFSQSVPTSATSLLGPFNADFSGGFGGTVEVDLSSVVGLSVLLVHPIGTH